jgi:hypothetical protein
MRDGPADARCSYAAVISAGPLTIARAGEAGALPRTAAAIARNAVELLAPSRDATRTSECSGNVARRVLGAQRINVKQGSRSSSDKTRLIPPGLTFADIGI